MPDGLHRLVYRSESNIAHDDIAGLKAIFDASVRNNRRHAITGALALPDGKFVQAIEGRRRDLDHLMARLQSDPRHSNLVMLGEWAITARLFQNWAMASPDPTPLGSQSFRIMTVNGSGAQVAGLLVDLMSQPDRRFSAGQF